MKIKLWILFTFINGILLAQGKPNLGISSFAVNSEISPQELKKLEEYIYDEFKYSEKFNVLDRTKTREEILADLQQLKAEQNLEQNNADQPGSAQGAIYLLVGEFNGFSAVFDDVTEKEDRETGRIRVTRRLGVGFEFSLQLIDVSTGEVLEVKTYNASGSLGFSPGEPEFLAPKSNFEERLRRKAIGTAGYYAKKFIKTFAKPQLVLTKVLKGNSRKVKKFYMEGDGEAWGALRLDVYILEAYEVEGEKIYRKVNIGEAKKKREMFPGLIKGKMAKGNRRVKEALNAGKTVYLKENNRSRNFLVGFFLLPLRLFGPLHKEED